MLVLARKPGEKVCIGQEITFTVIAVQGNRVRLGIEAPAAMRVIRTEHREPPAENGSEWSSRPHLVAAGS